MKKITLLLSIVLFLACGKDDAQDGVYAFGAGYLEYEATIGNDLDSALDSLLKVVPYDDMYSGSPYLIETEKMDRVDYLSDDRDFYMVKVMDSITGYILGSPSNAIDTKGSWYRIFWTED